MQKLLILILTAASIYALDYGIDFRNDPFLEIKELQIFGERHCGTNFIEQLLIANFPTFKKVPGFCHKHFPPWVHVDPASYLLEKQSENYLTVVIFRNAYDWVRAFHPHPWHGHPSLVYIPFNKFIRSKWRLNDVDIKLLNPNGNKFCLDRNPNTGKYFHNVLQLRAAKTDAMLTLKKYCHNIYFVRYETVLKHPQEVIDEIASLFDLEKKSSFQKIKYYKGDKSKGKYKKKKYARLTQKDLDFMNQHLDLSLEHQTGYAPIYDAKKIP